MLNKIREDKRYLVWSITLRTIEKHTIGQNRCISWFLKNYLGRKDSPLPLLYARPFKVFFKKEIKRRLVTKKGDFCDLFLYLGKTSAFSFSFAWLERPFKALNESFWRRKISFMKSFLLWNHFFYEIRLRVYFMQRALK